MTRNLYALLSSALLALTLSACATPGLYSAESIEARVVDAETEQPIKDVIVVAHWQLMGGLEGGNPVGQLMVMEALSDEQGRFYFPAWEKWHWGQGWLGDEDPELIIFKSDFRYISVTNSEYTRPSKYRDARKPSGSSKRSSFWNGETIRMERFEGTMGDYEGNFESVNGSLERVAADHPNECNWMKIPYTIRAMNQERMRLISQGVNPNTLSSIDQELFINDEYYTKKGGCGSPKQFFKDIQQ